MFGQSRSRSDRHRAEHRGGTGHVHLHEELHALRRLQVDAAGVIHDALADHDEVPTLALGAFRLVGELDHARRFRAAGVHAENATAAQFLEITLVEDLDREPARARHFLGDFGHALGRQLHGRRIGEVARKHRRRGHRLTELRAGRLGLLPFGRRHQRERFKRRIALLALALLVAVARQQHAFGDGLRRGRRRDAAGDVGEPGGQMRLPGRGPGECRGRVTQSGDIEAGIADAYRNDNGLSVLWNDQGLALLALEARGRERVAIQPDLSRYCSLRSDGDSDSRGARRHRACNADRGL